MNKTNLTFIIANTAELNASLIPFINGGGIFIPTNKQYALGDHITVDVHLPGKNDPLIIAGDVIWINPKNALHHALPGIGIQFTGADAKNIRTLLESLADPALTIGSHVYGIQQ